jgi:hypothetical protein
VADARNFRLQIEDWIAREVPQRAVALQKQIVAETLTAIVQATPVGNQATWKRNVGRSGPPLPRGYVGGQARRNWQVTLDVPSRTVKGGVDATGATSTTEGFAAIGRITSPSKVWIANPLPYMERLENGWSKQAPTGMVANAVAAVSAKYARVR